MAELKETLPVAVKTGSVEYGFNKAVNTLLTAEPELLILAKNLPSAKKDRIVYYSRLANIPLLYAQETSGVLANLCGRPHTTSVITILDQGDAQLVERQ